MKSPSEQDVPSEARTRQQKVLAEFGQRALEGVNLDRLLEEAAVAVAETLETPYVTVSEVQPGGADVLVRAGVGWRNGVVGEPTVALESHSPANRALDGASPALVEDLRAERGDTEAFEHLRREVESGIIARIGSAAEPWGVFEAYATERRTFTECDGNFVQAVANVLAMAIEAERTQPELEEMHERISDAFYSLDENWEFRYLNERAEELIDYTNEGLVGRNIWETFEWGADSELRREYELSMATQEPTSFELYYPEPLDSWYEINAHPSETGLSVYFRDVTERKSIERELQENNETLQRLYEITADRNRTFEEKVDRLLELGRERLELDVGLVASIDPSEDRFEVIHAIGDDDRLHTGLQTSLSETYCRRTIESDELIVLADASDDRWADDPAYERWDFRTYVGGKVLVDEELYGTICFADDARSDPFTVAELSFVELVSQWLSYELERQHHRMELEELITRLETSNERLEQFAYAASHDLQEPLRMVTSYLQLVERRYADDLDADGEEFIEFAVDGAARMREMIDGLLEYSRVETRGNPFELIDLEVVLEDVLADLDVRIEETDAEITADSLPAVTADVSQLRQVFQNLLQNAIEYSGDRAPRVRITAERASSRWIVSVADEGIGISPDDQDRIFEVFQRLHSRDEYAGTGIGLALCKRIVERHGGEIWVESTPGEGSTFSFTLPVRRDRAA